MKRTVKFNRVYAPLADLDCRYIDIYGGRSSGKSVAASQIFARKVWKYRRRIVVMRKYATTLRMSVWPRVQAALDEGPGLQYCEINKSDREIKLPNGSVFWFVGADDPQKLKSIEEATDYWLEEATEFTEEDFDTVDAGLRANVDPPCQIVLTHNPVPVAAGLRHWIQERMLSVAHKLGRVAVRGNTAVLRTYYKHNRFCPQAAREVLERYRTTNPELYKMWALGLFTYLKGVILRDNWDIVSEVPKGVDEVGYGLDFGFAQDPAAVIKVWQRRDEIWVKQIIYETGLTNPELSGRMEEEGIRKRRDHIVADSAEPKSIRELRNLGWIVTGSEKGPDYKRAAAQYLRGLQIHILEGSGDLVKEAGAWSWKQDRQGNVLPVPADGNDHGIDALIYRLYKRKKRVGVVL